MLASFRHVSKDRDAQVLPYKFQVAVLIDRPRQRLGQADVIRDHRAVGGGANLFEGEPDFERTKANAESDLETK